MPLHIKRNDLTLVIADSDGVLGIEAPVPCSFADCNLAWDRILRIDIVDRFRRNDVSLFMVLRGLTTLAALATLAEKC
jgi:hypothetical protein